LCRYGLCDEKITPSEDPYRVCCMRACLIVCNQETCPLRRPWPELGCGATKKKALGAIRLDFLTIQYFPFSVTSEMQKWWLAENTKTAECTDILMYKMFVMHRSR